MPASPFVRPRESASQPTGSWGDESVASELPVDVFLRREQKGNRPQSSDTQRFGSVRFRSVVVIAAVALLVGLAVGVLAIYRPTPAAIPITLDSFPQEMFGVPREDVLMREGGSETVMGRLDSHFADEVNGYRLAYGGEGAAFGYGNFVTLEIVNGQLVTEIPISGDTEWANDLTTSLITRDTTCVSSENTFMVQYNGRKGLTDQTQDEFNGGDPDVEVTSVAVFTDCVLFDQQRNLALRLSGPGPNNDIIEDAGEFRDELERLHTLLVS